MYSFVVGHKVCREAFIQITGISSEILQSARSASDQENNASALVLLTPLRNEGRELKYVSIRSWLLDYASTYADTSPLNHCYFLPQGRKQFFWAVYDYQETQREAPVNTIGGLDLFLKVWRQDLPFIKLHTSTSTFIACGLCEYLKALAAQTFDMTLRSTIL